MFVVVVAAVVAKPHALSFRIMKKQIQNIILLINFRCLTSKIRFMNSLLVLIQRLI